MAKKEKCPFSPEEINAFKAMLYNVNTSNHCMNPAPMTWIKGFQYDECDRIGREGLYKEEQKDEERCY